MSAFGWAFGYAFGDAFGALDEETVMLSRSPSGAPIAHRDELRRRRIRRIRRDDEEILLLIQ